MTGYFRC